MKIYEIRTAMSRALVNLERVATITQEGDKIIFYFHVDETVV